ncbi:hypothetical protein HRbin40_01259 [bacterium HR40]|nr:hypothetical protein HRbin40_01259 [bacterium HR40]
MARFRALAILLFGLALLASEIIAMLERRIERRAAARLGWSVSQLRRPDAAT